MKEPIPLQIFAEQAAPENGAQNEEAAASAQDEDNTGAAPDAEPAGKAPETATPAAPAGTPPEGKRAEEKQAAGTDAAQAPPPTPAENGAGLLAGVAAALEAKRANDGLKRIVAEWEESARALREIYPGFDLKTEARENPEFARLLRAGVSVRRAYEAANLEAILGEAMRYAVRTAGKKAAESMRSQSGRVQENSVLDRAPSLAKKDVGSLTKADILKILDEVSRGAKISF